MASDGRSDILPDASTSELSLSRSEKLEEASRRGNTGRSASSSSNTDEMEGESRTIPRNNAANPRSKINDVSALPATIAFTRLPLPHINTVKKQSKPEGTEGAFWPHSTKDGERDGQALTQQRASLASRAADGKIEQSTYATYAVSPLRSPTSAKNMLFPHEDFGDENGKNEEPQGYFERLPGPGYTRRHRSVSGASDGKLGRVAENPEDE